MPYKQGFYMTEIPTTLNMLLCPAAHSSSAVSNAHGALFHLVTVSNNAMVQATESLS